MVNLHFLKEEYFKDITKNARLFKTLTLKYPGKIFIVSNGPIIWEKENISLEYQFPLQGINGEKPRTTKIKS